MRKAIEQPPELSNPIGFSPEGMHGQVRISRLSGKVFKRFASIVTGAALLSGCDALPSILTALPDLNTPTAKEVSPTATLVASTETPTPTETPKPAYVLTLGPLPSNNDPYLPFPGYKQENYTVGWNSLKNDWNQLWTKWELMTADGLGPGGSLTVRPVEGEAGIVCEDAIDGSYKGMVLCPPQDLVNGGFLAFPGIDASASTDYYPLFIQRTSQFARLKLVGTGTGLVLQEVDSAGAPTRYIKPKNDADGNGGVWVTGEYVPPLVLPATDTILSTEQLAEKHLYGSGFELKTEFQGIPVDITIVTSNATLAQYKQTRGCFPNQKMQEYGASAEDRIAEMVFLGHYVGYLRDSGLTEKNYPFEKYITDLKAGKNRSYTIWGPKPDGSNGEFEVDPLAPIEYVATNAKVDPDGNGRTLNLWSNNVTRQGYQQLENGGLRIVIDMGFELKDFLTFCENSSGTLTGSFLYLGANIELLQSTYQLMVTRYPKTQARLGELVFVLQIYIDSGGKTSDTVLSP